MGQARNADDGRTGLEVGEDDELVLEQRSSKVGRARQVDA